MRDCGISDIGGVLLAQGVLNHGALAELKCVGAPLSIGVAIGGVG